MGTSQAQKAQSRERILAVAARQIRVSGMASVSIADLMKEAGLTHGAFYAHFASRDALLAAALERALDDGARNASRAYGSAMGDGGITEVVDAYLTPAHRDAPHRGCAVPALAAETGRADAALKDIMRGSFESYVDNLATRLGGGAEAREKSLAAWSTMVGAILLARLADDKPLGDEILAAARKNLLGQ